MKRKKINRIKIFISLTISLLISCGIANASENIQAPEGLHAVKHSANSIRVYWQKVEGATAYNVYAINHKTGGKVKLATTKNTQYVQRNLKGHKVRHYKVQAIGNGGKSKLSYAVCAKNWQSKNVTNISKVKVNKTKLILDLMLNQRYAPDWTKYKSKYNKDVKVKSQVVASCGGKMPFNKNVRWYSSNKNIAKVAKDGVVTPINGGVCYIYAKAQNGVNSKKIKVIVKDYAFVSSFNKPRNLTTSELETMAVELLQERKSELCNIV